MIKRLLVTTEQHFQRYSGQIYTDIALPYEYWREYLDVFDEVKVVARVRDIEEFPKHLIRADGKGVSFVGLPDYYGPWQFAKVALWVLARCFNAVRRSDYILLCMGNIATCVWFCAKVLHKSYAVELLGDPFEATIQAKQAGSHILDWFFAKIIHRMNILQARSACCAGYVCEYLHQRYHTKYPEREFVFSDVLLPEELIALPGTQDSLKSRDPIIVSVGRLMPEKGHKTLVEVADRLRELRGDKWQIRIIGGGPEMENLRKLIELRGLRDKVYLLGVVKWGPDLFKLLDDARLFVLPSLTEGMPRALIEAMAKGLPAIGSKVGGIIDLLDEEDLVEPGDVDMLAERINAVLNDIPRLERMSRRNFQKAMEYRPEVIRGRKHLFWNTLIRNSRVNSEFLCADSLKN